ncbi:hypothetical protein D3C78_794490 [compost metagenome]
MRHAKPLLFINNQQTQIFKYKVLREQSMCSDHDIDRTLANPLDRLILLFPAAESA